LLRYGYITNGLADHTLEQAIDLLSCSGYEGIGITLESPHLDPIEADAKKLAEIGSRLAAAGLQPAVETGARFALDARRKHWPSMVSDAADDRHRRVQYYQRAVEIAAAIGAPVVSLWSGVAEVGVPRERCLDHLLEALVPVLDGAEAAGVRIGFEPEPGMVVESLADWRWLRGQVNSEVLGLTVDLGHLAVTEAAPLATALDSVRQDVIHVHVDDCRGGVHEHLPFGTGEIDFKPLLQMLIDDGYSGLALVELSRDSHRAPELVEASIRYLRDLERSIDGREQR